ncbi:amidohydrolase family protein [Streptomyces sp. NPDC092296]|uniref:amidohydrolase family protein n=1 Tax=Streptomyces sp. NPDC092296 TaxID=3366012 RepID=UPI00381F6844
MSSTGTPLVDVHTHFVTEEYIAAAKAAGHLRPDGMPGWPGWRAEEQVALMDGWGVGTAVLSVSSPGTHFGDDRAARSLTRQVNEYGRGIARAHPGRFGHFASLPLPDVEGARRELAHALDESGSDGVTVETNAGGVYLGDRRYDPLYAELDARAAVVFVHPTSPPCFEQLSLGRPRPMLEFSFDSARTVSDLVFSGVLTRYPGIQWIITHGGGALPLLADRMELFRSVFFGGGPGGPGGPSVPQQLAGLWFDMAGTPFPHQVPALVRAFGSDRLLYGSDSCWTPAPGVTAQVATVDGAEQPAGDSWRALTTRNAERLLPRLLRDRD